MTIAQSIILGIVEGLTEFMPISSTGHMIIAEGVMGMRSNEFLKAFTVVIQFGAILSVIVLYSKRFFSFHPASHIKAPLPRFLSGLRFYFLLLTGIIPAAGLGLLFESYIDDLLGNVYIVAIMLIAGGILMLFIDRIFRDSHREKITYRNAFVIGLFQCVSMIPGVSRSMATIVGGLQQGISRKQAAEFSFFLAVPTMFGAMLLKGIKLFKSGGIAIFQEHMPALVAGNITAFIVALLAIRFFINILTRYGFKAFGYYRIVVGVIILVLLLTGMPLAMES